MSRIVGSVGDAQLAQCRTDRLEGRDQLIGGFDLGELVAAAGAVLQQGRGRIAAGVDVDRVDRDASRLGVGAGADAVLGRVVHALVDAARDLHAVAVPAVLGVEAVRHQNDHVGVDVIRVLGRCGQRAAADERLPGPDQADRLIGTAARLHVVDERVERGPVIGQALDRRRTGVVLLRRIFGCGGRGRHIDLLVPVVGVRRVGTAAIGDAAVPAIVVGYGPPAAAVHAIGFGVVRAPARRCAAATVVFVEIGPVDIALVVGAGAEIDVLGERHDGDIDVAVFDRCRLELRQQVLGGGLERGHLAVVGHRAGIVERERDAQLVHAPLGGRCNADRHIAVAHQPHEIGVHRGAAVEHDLRAAGGGIGCGDEDVLRLGPGEQRCEIVVGLGADLCRGHRACILRQHQRGGVDGGLHGCLGRVCPTVIDRAADKADDRDGGQRKGGGDVAGIGTFEIAPGCDEAPCKVLPDHVSAR